MPNMLPDECFEEKIKAKSFNFYPLLELYLFCFCEINRKLQRREADRESGQLHCNPTSLFIHVVYN